MIRFFLDTETNGFSGEVFALALVREDGESIYLMDTSITDRLQIDGSIDPWVVENVIPFLRSVPDEVTIRDWPKNDWPEVIGEFLYRDTSAPAQVFADFPLDIAALLSLMMVNAKETVAMPQQTHYTVMRRIRVYPTSLEGAVRHNAWWDAMALRRWVEDNSA